jgi:hypothetical protein
MCMCSTSMVSLFARGGPRMLLPPAQAKVLLEWLRQRCAGGCRKEASCSGARPVVHSRPWPGQCSAGGTLAVTRIAEANLRGLAGPDSTASCKRFERAQGRFSVPSGWQAQLASRGAAELEQGQPQETALAPVGALDGELLFTV